MAQIYADICKIDAKKRIVEGYATTTSVDRDGQSMDADFLQREFPKWADKYGNIRYMHQAIPVGKLIDRSEFDGQGYYITVKVDDDKTWRQIEDGILNGFSIGVKSPRIVPDQSSPKGKIVDGEIIETSIVDLPSCRDADFQVVKAATYDLDSHSWTESNDIDSAMVQLKWLSKTLERLQENVPQWLEGEQVDDTADLYKRYYSDKERAHMDESDFAGPHRSFPIESQSDVDNAARLIGHADDPEAVKRRIISIAHRKGFKLPDAWQDDTHKDVALDSGLQGKNLEGQEDKSAMADAKCKECGTELEDDKCPKCADADVKKEAGVTDMNDTNGVVADESKSTSVLDLVLSKLEDIQGQINALASQTDGDKDGDIDTTADEEDKGDDAKEGDIEDDVTGKSTDADVTDAPVTFTDAQLDVIKSLIAESVTSALSQQADVSKSLVADETKSLVADVTKRVDEAFESLGKFAERLEVVEQSAAPAKGAVMERDGGVAKTVQTTAEVLAILQKQAREADDQTQTQAFAHLYKTTIPTGGQI